MKTEIYHIKSDVGEAEYITTINKKQDLDMVKFWADGIIGFLEYKKEDGTTYISNTDDLAISRIAARLFPS